MNTIGTNPAGSNGLNRLVNNTNSKNSSKVSNNQNNLGINHLMLPDNLLGIGGGGNSMSKSDSSKSSIITTNNANLIEIPQLSEGKMKIEIYLIH